MTDETPEKPDRRLRVRGGRFGKPSDDRDSKVRSFLLNTMPAVDREQIEDQLLQDDDFFSHVVATEQDLLDAHASGYLAAADVENFSRIYGRSPIRSRRARLAKMLYRAFSPVGPPAEAAADLQSGRSKREFSEDVNSARRSHRTPEPVASAADYSQMQRVVTELLEPMAARDHLSATDLHEVYLRLAKAQPSLVGDPAEFAPMFAKVIRRLLIDLARARRDAGLSLDRTAARTATDIGAQDHLLAVDQALERLAQASPLQARIVELRFFAGLSEEEIATVLGLPARTVRRDARIAMVQMHALMTDVSS